jgi:hypothetical protein
MKLEDDHVLVVECLRVLSHISSESEQNCANIKSGYQAKYLRYEKIMSACSSGAFPLY